jgi:hypothetical protein
MSSKFLLPIVIPRLAGTMTDAANFSGQTNGRLSYPAWGLPGQGSQSFEEIHDQEYDSA